MTERTNSIIVASCKWSMEEREQILATGTLDERKEAFKDDEELMRETSKFVIEVIETATTEASRCKMYSERGDASEGTRLKGEDSIAGWNHRARGFCNRILNALCPCFTNNELFAWTPYRYRFTRP
ncbi:uncharacterized protein LOC122399440 isoform X2 [Colletes gigas]|uniref:uncharacterized protein LOC122399440 isoform X2 n=1 Tax=Colletes gigas TaxID=935657 RepID=UPI001C9A3C4D|nr:uncharacterized protein LOC122399440 isoform X2 [Colletes gigas]XP_043256061.1 uncharacterized protein LOC122399440 isoform X2 [Colletes gigas]